MKILHIITSLHPDGAQQMLRRLIFGTQKSIEHVIVSLSSPIGLSDEFANAGFEVVHLELPKVTNPLRAAKRLKTLVQELKPDLIQSWLYHANFLAALALRQSPDGPPLVWGIRSSYTGLTRKTYKTSLLVLASKFLAHVPACISVNSPASIEQHIKLGFPREKMIFLPNGFDTERFAPNASTRSRVRVHYGLSDDDIVVQICGRDDFTKDYPTFLKAFELARKEKPTLKALIVGRGVDTSVRLQEIISSLSLKESVVTVGYSTKAEELMAAADIGCSTSVSEGFPNVVAEAMLCGLPMVVTDVGMSRELVDSIGSVVPPRDAPAISREIIRFAMMSDTERRELGSKGRARIAHAYGLESVLNTFSELYKMVVLKHCEGK